MPRRTPPSTRSSHSCHTRSLHLTHPNETRIDPPPHSCPPSASSTPHPATLLPHSHHHRTRPCDTSDTPPSPPTATGRCSSSGTRDRRADASPARPPEWRPDTPRTPPGSRRLFLSHPPHTTHFGRNASTLTCDGDSRSERRCTKSTTPRDTPITMNEPWMVANSYAITNSAIPHEQEQEHIVPHRYALGVCPSLQSIHSPLALMSTTTLPFRFNAINTPTLVRHEHAWNRNLFITSTSILHIERILLILLPS